MVASTAWRVCKSSPECLQDCGGIARFAAELAEVDLVLTCRAFERIYELACVAALLAILPLENSSPAHPATPFPLRSQLLATSRCPVSAWSPNPHRQNVHSTWPAKNTMPVLSYEPTRSPRPPTATGTELCSLTLSVPPYMYSAATPQLKVWLTWSCAPIPRRHAELTGSMGDTFDESWNPES